MIKIDQQNLLQVVQDYYSTIGLKAAASNFFTSHKFDTGIILCLPDVCLFPKNKPSTSRSNQTHIHVTGDGRYFFFPAHNVDGDIVSSTDKHQLVTVSKSNIEHLQNRTLLSFSSLNNEETFTLTKIAYRENQNSQVQISKIRQDGPEFIQLREGLFTHDLLIFLKYRDKDKYFAIGIPTSFYKGKYELPDSYLTHLESKGNISVRAALKDVEENIDTTALITDSDEITDAIYQQLVDDADAEDDNEVYTSEKFDISSSGKIISSNRPNTNPRLGKSVIKHYDYKCIFTAKTDAHQTFFKPNGIPYMEVHHLIPIGQQPNFYNKLDTKANLVPVCPLCHRKLHHGRKSDVDLMLTELFNNYSSLLIQSGLDKTKDGIPLTDDLLKSFY